MYFKKYLYLKKTKNKNTSVLLKFFLALQTPLEQYQLLK